MNKTFLDGKTLPEKMLELEEQVKSFLANVDPAAIAAITTSINEIKSQLSDKASDTEFELAKKDIVTLTSNLDALLKTVTGLSGTKNRGHFATEAELDAAPNPQPSEYAWVGSAGAWAQYVYEDTAWIKTGGTSTHTAGYDPAELVAIKTAATTLAARVTAAEKTITENTAAAAAAKAAADAAAGAATTAEQKAEAAATAAAKNAADIAGLGSGGGDSHDEGRMVLSGDFRARMSGDYRKDLRHLVTYKSVLTALYKGRSMVTTDDSGDWGQSQSYNGSHRTAWGTIELNGTFGRTGGQAVVVTGRLILPVIGGQLNDLDQVDPSGMLDGESLHVNQSLKVYGQLTMMDPETMAIKHHVLEDGASDLLTFRAGSTYFIEDLLSQITLND